MGDRIAVAIDVLQDTGQALRFVATEFEQATDVRDQYIDDLGHDGLRGAVEEFTDNWSVRRSKMVSSIAGLGDASEGIGSAFGQADVEAAQPLFDMMTQD